MRIAKESADELILTEQSTWLGVICGLAAALLFGVSLENRNWKGLLPAALFAFSAFMCLRTSRVRFDKASRTAVLDQFRAFKRSRTSLPFDAVHNVVIDIDGSEHQPPCRLVLQTPDGPQPLTSAYSSTYAAHTVLRLAVLKILERSPTDALTQSLRYLVGVHRTIDAIALLRSQEKMDLTSARDRIVAMEKELKR
jgi:hypothetical protein